MKKKRFWYPLVNIKNRFLFGAYGRDVYIEPGVVINRPRYAHLGHRVRIKQFTNINLHLPDRRSKGGLLFLGNGASFAQGCIISAYNRIVIGENTIIGPYTLITDNSRKPGDVRLPSRDQEVVWGHVDIGPDCFIGFNACILMNVTIGKHCIIGAASVVTRDIPAYSIVAGAPAKVIKRFDFDRREWVKVVGSEIPESQFLRCLTCVDL
jgi:acetyltransferase-like isoleucine patch superfamily enzyme